MLPRSMLAVLKVKPFIAAALFLGEEAPDSRDIDWGLGLCGPSGGRQGCHGGDRTLGTFGYTRKETSPEVLLPPHQQASTQRTSSKCSPPTSSTTTDSERSSPQPRSLEFVLFSSLYYLHHH